VVSFAHYTLSVFFSEKWLCRFMLSMRFSKFCYLVKERLKKGKKGKKCGDGDITNGKAYIKKRCLFITVEDTGAGYLILRFMELI
jgi:hypothetical protein